MSNIVKAGQSLLDKTVECTGSIEELFNVAFANGKQITDDLIVGEQLIIPTVSNKAVKNYFKDYSPATGIIKELIDYEFEFVFPQGEFPISL